MTAPAPKLEVEDLRIGGAEFLVVDKVSFTLAPGESFGIAGESGSGKSTLLLSLMGMMRQGLQHMGGLLNVEPVHPGCAFVGFDPFPCRLQVLSRQRHLQQATSAFL